MKAKKLGLRPGQALLELAVALPVLLLLTLGIMAFGQMFSHQLVLNNATREAARFGVVCVTALPTDAEIDAIVRNRAATLAHRDDPAYLEVWINPPQGDAARVGGNPLTIQVRYKDYIAVPIAGVFLNPKILMSRTTMRIETCSQGGGGSSSGGSSSGSTSSGGTSSGSTSSGGTSSGGSSGDDHGGSSSGGSSGDDHGGSSSGGSSGDTSSSGSSSGGDH